MKRACLYYANLFFFVLLAVGTAGIASAVPEDLLAKEILRETGVQGGLIVHLGCDAGKLTAALGSGESYMAQGLDTNAEEVAQAKAYFKRQGVYGKLTAEHMNSTYLPYADNTVNLVVVEEMGAVSQKEILRVLAPKGVAYIKNKDRWTAEVKPRPEEMDEWTHYLYDASNNAVSKDTLVDQPNHLQWVGAPRSARSHDHLASMSGAVSSNGRVFYIADEGPLEALAFPAEWTLTARDAFNGVLLWKKPIGAWEGHLRGFRSGPPELQRRLVSIGDRLYVTLGYGEPVTALDAATGEVVHTYQDTEDTLEILYEDGILYLVLGQMDVYEAMRRRQGSPPPRDKRIMAVKAETGEVLWEKQDKDTEELMPQTLAAKDDRLYMQNPDRILCLNAADASVVWQVDRPIRKQRWGWSTPTLVIHDGIVFSADRAGPKEEGGKERADLVQWDPSSRGGEAPAGELIAYSADNGDELWRCRAREAYNAPPDVLITDDILWTGDLVHRRDPGITKGRDFKTGEVVKERAKDQDYYSFGFGHHRCYRNKATEKFLLVGRSGVELQDVETGDVIVNHWIRGTCQYGIMPGNGLIYVPPHSCACFIEAKLNGFMAFASQAKDHVTTDERLDVPRLEKGPAYGKSAPTVNDGNAWPTYRNNPIRSGSINTAMPSQVKRNWRINIGGKLSSPVAADGKIFVAQIDNHTIHALDARNGRPIWQFTAGGRVDSPPTIHNGLAYFGSADGYVYCLRAADGALAWKFRAAPYDERIVVYDQLESVWPVHGNILVLKGEDGTAAAYFAAGRCSYIDSGIYVYKLDAETGAVEKKTCLNNLDPETGLPPLKEARGVNIPGALPDVLSCDGESIYMRHTRFDKNLNKQEPNVEHLFSPAGFMDDTWWHRTYWMYGTDMNSGWGGWPRAGLRNPAGRLLVMNEKTIFGYGRLGQYNTHGTHVGLPADLLPWPPPKKQDVERGHVHYELFATPRDLDRTEEAAKEKRRGKENIKELCHWAEPLDVVTRSMVLADDTLFIAGPTEMLTPSPAKLDGRALEAAKAAYEGKKGAYFQAISAETGEKLASLKLESAPILDGMIAADNHWYIATVKGELLCLGEK
ncbi:PQQ-binding-like beta-propeller repeat protein [bacterium]|nr:PQQ-binding-like beta-propeller repeat protein [bacterium]